MRRTASIPSAVALAIASSSCGPSSEPPLTPAMAALQECAPVAPPTLEGGEPLAIVGVVICVGAPREGGSSVVRIGARSLGSGANGRLDPAELEGALEAASAGARPVTIVADEASLATTTAQILEAATRAEASAVHLGTRGPEGLRIRDLEGPPPIPYPDIADEPDPDPQRKYLHLERSGIAYASTAGDCREASPGRDLEALLGFVDERRVEDPHWDHPLTLRWIAGTTYGDLVAVTDVVLERFDVAFDPDAGDPERWSAASAVELHGAMHAPWPPAPLADVLGVLATEAHPTATDPTGTPHVEVGDLDVRGSVSVPAVERVVRRHRADVLACYAAAIETEPTLAGHATVAFIISPAGTVSATYIAHTTLHDDSVERCLTTAVRTWTFPEPRGGGIAGVNCPFAFDRGRAP